MKWIDTYEIVDALLEKYPEKNPEKILFTDLRNLVSNLKGFDDELDKCNERKILVLSNETYYIQFLMTCYCIMSSS